MKAFPHHELARAYQADGSVKEAITLLEKVVKVEEETLEETTLIDWRRSTFSHEHMEQSDGSRRPLRCWSRW